MNVGNRICWSETNGVIVKLFSDDSSVLCSLVIACKATRSSFTDLKSESELMVLQPPKLPFCRIHG